MRENGFYWVEMWGKWTIAEYRLGGFELLNYEDNLLAEELDAIGDKIDIPEKYR